MVEVSGYGGYEWRGKPDGFDAPTGAFMWGTGVTFPSRNFLRVNGELSGQALSGSNTTLLTANSLRGIDLSFPPTVSTTENITRATLGITLQSKKGWFASAGVSWNVPSRARSAAFTNEPDVLGDYYDMQFRIGYHPGVRVYVPPAPPPEAPPPPPAHRRPCITSP